MQTLTTAKRNKGLKEEEDVFEYSLPNGSIGWRDETKIDFNEASLGNKLAKESITNSDQHSLDTNSSEFMVPWDIPEEYDSNNCVHKLQVAVAARITTYRSLLSTLMTIVCLTGYTVYLAFAIKFDFELAKALIVITGIVVFCLIYCFIRDHFGSAIYETSIKPLITHIEKHWHIIQWFFYPLCLITFVIYLVGFVISEIKQLQSLSGIVIFISFTYLTSKYPDRVKWRPVLWGYGLQIIMAILVLRWDTGYYILKFFGQEMTKFFNYAYEGASVVYGDPWMIFHPFAMMGLSIVIYMGAVMAISYYYGITQVLAAKTAWLMQITMKTTAIETLAVASNIFLNGMDSMLMLQKYLDKLTPSEFHTFVVGGHATVAGFVFGLFVLFGAPPQHLLSAAVMSAPAVIGITKLNFPETRKSITERIEDVELAKGEEINVFEACANGVAVAGKTVATVLLNYIAFMSLLAWLNATLAWLGGRVGYPELSFEGICSYVFWPIALVIGVDTADCREVAKLIGIKMFTTEILAFQELGRSSRAGLISARSTTLATYALCGFSSISTLAIGIGVWNSMCPQRTQDMARDMLRAITNANISCFMTACIAGLMFREELIAEPEQIPPIIGAVMDAIPSYEDLMALVPGLVPE